MMSKKCVSIRPDQVEWIKTQKSLNVSGLLQEAIDRLITESEEKRKNEG